MNLTKKLKIKHHTDKRQEALRVMKPLAYSIYGTLEKVFRMKKIFCNYETTIEVVTDMYVEQVRR